MSQFCIKMLPNSQCTIVHTRKSNQKANVILVEVSQIVSINIAFWLTTIILLINKKDQPKGCTEGSLADGREAWNCQAMSCLKGQKSRVGQGSGVWAFSEAGKGSEERERSQHIKKFKISRDSNCCHEFSRLEFKLSQPN